MSAVMPRTPFAIWLTGLPASGKSSIVERLLPKLSALGMTVEVLESDALRRVLTPEASYSREERDLFYRALGLMGPAHPLSGAAGSVGRSDVSLLASFERCLRRSWACW